MDINYYVNLLIKQYWDKTKARLTVETDIKDNVDLYNNILSKLTQAFSVENAVGKQLDIVGDYVGQKRQVNTLLNQYLLAMDDLNIVLTQYDVGLSDINNLIDGYVLDLENLNVSNYSMDDETYRFFIKLKIANNNGKKTDESIEQVLYELFNGSIIFISNTDMTINYILTSSTNENIKAILTNNKRFLPAPAGVDISLIISINSSKLFGFSDVNDLTPPDFINGLSDVNNLLDGDLIDINNIL